MKIIFFGTPEYVVPIAEALRVGFTRKDADGIRAVVTQPPKETGRKRERIHSPVDDWSYSYKIPAFFDPNQIPEPDLGVVAAYGKIIPQSVIDKFKYGILNIHPSLLPKYRGASPVQAAIAAGDELTGVTIIKMDSQVDHGPIVGQFKEKIGTDDTTETLRKRLFERAADFLVELIPNYINGKIIPKKQDDNQATFTKVLTRENGFIDLTKSDPVEVERFIRAMHPWPGAWSWVKAKNEKLRLKLLKAHFDTKSKKLILDEVQLEGKNPVSWDQFTAGYPKAEFVA